MQVERYINSVNKDIRFQYLQKKISYQPVNYLDIFSYYFTHNWINISIVYLKYRNN